MLQVSFQPGSIESGLQYRLVLPEGSNYGGFSGSVKQASSLPFQGLAPFIIPFFTADNQALEDVRYRRIDLLLPHGLQV